MLYVLLFIVLGYFALHILVFVLGISLPAINYLLRGKRKKSASKWR